MPDEGALPQPVVHTPWSRVTAGQCALVTKEVEIPGSWELNPNCWLTLDSLICLITQLAAWVTGPESVGVQRMVYCALVLYWQSQDDWQALYVISS